MTNYKENLVSLKETVKGAMKKGKKALSQKIPTVLTNSKKPEKGISRERTNVSAMGQRTRGDLAPPKKARKK